MKVVIIGGRGTASVIADQMYDAHCRFGMGTVATKAVESNALVYGNPGCIH